ncbi:hypothetical protein [Actinomadura rubrisoli]|uniref:Uncharacterized protein n=1 Tax=Actinomadura rubrisoli TaxID=2530368 RepID=A0A4R5CEC7_9ACTN|nr:hypothetical protein [Actinomadura rubrisoli]TDD96700.1 hypothetical protein E1298_02700 [Actinomadura rubrisoli]
MAVEKDPSGLVTRVPDIGQVASRSIPPEVAKGRYLAGPYNDPRGVQSFSWKVFDARQNRNLTLEVARKPSIAEAKVKAMYVRSAVAGAHVQEGRQVTDTGPAETIPNLADECLGFRISRKNAASAIPQDGGQKYSMSGRYLYCRFKNVNIVIDWEGLDYARPRTIDSGTGLNQAAADRDTRRLAQAIVGALR